jgi:speckle-type POZ protein
MGKKQGAGILRVEVGQPTHWVLIKKNQRTGLSFSIHKEALRTFDPKDLSEISIHPKKRSLFESSNYLHGDCLTIECFVTVTNGRFFTETKSLPRIEVPPPGITEHFAKLLETEEGVDVTFSVGGVNFKAHKMVLATRPPYSKQSSMGL